jgi:capsular polysaccharide biosynthesis protein
VRHVLEIIFRRLLLLLIIIVALPLISVVITYLVVPHTYMASASLWALRRYEIIGDTTIQPNPPPTPADTQVAALSTLLQTRNFDLSVANQANLALTLDANISSSPTLRDQAMVDDIAKHVQVASQGDNLFTVVYTNRNAQIAQKVVTAVVQNFALQSAGFSQLQGQHLLDNYQKQLADAAQSADTAAAKETQYLAAHPQVARNILYAGPDYAQLFDPEYGILHAQSLQTLSRLQAIQNQMATVQLEVAEQAGNADTLFKVVDAPVVPTQPEGRSKSFLTYGGAGLGIALLACAIYIIVLVRGDQALYTKLDLRTMGLYPVVIQLPHVTSSDMLALVKWSLQNGNG